MDFLLGVPGKLTTIDGKVDTVDTNVDAILVDTGTTLPATLATIDGKIDTVDTNVDAVLVDTGTTLPATLATIEGKIDTIDTNVDTLVAAGSSIKSVQRGLLTAGGAVSPPYTINISAVDTSKSVLVCNNDTSNNPASYMHLSSSTTITVYNNYYSDPLWYRSACAWQVVEYN